MLTSQLALEIENCNVRSGPTSVCTRRILNMRRLRLKNPPAVAKAFSVACKEPKELSLEKLVEVFVEQETPVWL